MLVLDTDHFSELERSSSTGLRLGQRLASSPLEKSLTVITVEEQMRGWLAEISRRPEPHRQITPYSKFQRQVEVFSEWIVLPWDSEAANLFVQMRQQGVRIGSLDLKIACIVIAHHATLLSRNSLDFGKVPGLEVQNWLE